MSSLYFNISEELADFLGLETENVPRYEIVKKICEYVRDNQLVDDENKMVYHCDNELHYFMKKDTFAAFSIIRDLKEHLIPSSEVTYPNQILLENGYGEQLTIRSYTIDNEHYFRINNLEILEEDLYDYLNTLSSNYEEKQSSKKLEILFIGFFIITVLSLWLAVLLNN